MPHIEKRKIIKVGNSFAITIPKSWLRYFNLGAEDSVLIISDSDIIIRPLKKFVDEKESPMKSPTTLWSFERTARRLTSGYPEAGGQGRN